MKKLIQFCKEKGDRFGENLLQYDTLDIDIVIYFLDLAMPAISVRTYDIDKVFSPLSTTLTVAEEAFAVLQFENSMKRWIWLADKEVMRENQVNNSNHNSVDSIANYLDDDDIPAIMYQNNIKKRKDNVYTAGKWTEEGLERYNEFIGIVQKRRLNAQVFEQRLKAKMIESISSESLRKKRKKREVAVGKTAEPKRKVIVTNILNLTEV